ncbi:hypothetical protein QJS10_CPA03g02136 [Acorus calamus]|uniref:Glabrous enhancer-binding protein-like DBD domain-containing protein n=1 Tax=Acorus calamus TaxID=4465 RepID=A0AAV9F9C6_ACOCL|nr:hypothetical protein QJS10_CPA03g02136 [Acorus calamus]
MATKRTSATSSASASSTSATGSSSSASEGEAEKTSAAAPPPQPTEPSASQEPQPADPSIKPISSKPMDPSPTTTPPSSKPSSAIVTIKPSSASRKKKKPRTPASSSDLRRRLSSFSGGAGRFWSESDEIVILRGMVRFIAEKSNGAVPTSATEVTPLLDFIRGSLGVNPTPTQLSDKIRRLRMKYNNAGPAVDWSTPHDITAADLAKKIWAANSPIKEEPKSSSRKRSKSSARPARPARKAHKGFLAGFASHARSVLKDLPLENGLGDASLEEELAVEDGGADQYLFLNESLGMCRDLSKTGFTDGVLKKGLGLLRCSKARELEEKWRDLWELENELSERRVELVKEQMREISYALRLAGSS